MKAAEVMTASPGCVAPHRRAGARRPPVLDAGRTAGVPTICDLFPHVLRRFADPLGSLASSVPREPPGPHPESGA
ncbi:hypothetical protein ABZ478_19160 [Streptomyces sp. NPDC005706]|uniref:hypothetical protein n=1 Tax=Streptomyces sp. NPDC005706 TaxID=3157169 RepID=UPI0033F57821